MMVIAVFLHCLYYLVSMVPQKNATRKLKKSPFLGDVPLCWALFKNYNSGLGTDIFHPQAISSPLISEVSSTRSLFKSTTNKKTSETHNKSHGTMLCNSNLTFPHPTSNLGSLRPQPPLNTINFSKNRGI